MEYTYTVIQNLTSTWQKKFKLLQRIINGIFINLFFRSENHITNDSYRSKLSDLESERSIVKEEVNSKEMKLKEQKNAIYALQQELEKENTLQKSLQLEVNFVI